MWKLIELGLVLVVEKLGIDCLIGEPGKAANTIICLPRKKIIVFAGDNDIQQVPYSEHKPNSHVLARATQSITLLPGEQIHYQLPPSYVTSL